MIETTDVLRSSYELGAREPGRRLDCLGTVLVLAERMGLCAPDPWRSIRRSWIEGGLQCGSGFPPCWVRLTDTKAPWRDGDVLLFFGRHPWSAIICNGHVWSADEDVGSVYCRPVSRWSKQPAEVWRHDPTVHQEGPAG
jgi:hypothetical protein